MTMLARWTQAKKQFETITGRSKPVEKVLGKFRLSTGIEKALKACDKAEAGLETNPDKEKLNAAVKSLDRVIGTYLNKLTTEINAAKVAMGDDHKVYLKGLKYLKTTLEDVKGHFEGLARDTSGDLGDPIPGAKAELKKIVRKGRAATAELKLKLAEIRKAREAQEQDPNGRGDDLEVLEAPLTAGKESIEALKASLERLDHIGKTMFEDPGLPEIGPYVERLKTVWLDKGLCQRPASAIDVSIKQYNEQLKAIVQGFGL